MEIFKTIINIDLPIEQRRIVVLDTMSNFEKDKYFEIMTSKLAEAVYLLGKYLYSKVTKDQSEIVFGNIDFFSKNYDFPPQHPKKGVVYACHDFHPNFYAPVANFHEKSLELKMNDFFDLCESVGAKKCTLVYQEENKKVIMTNLDTTDIPTPKGKFSTNNLFNSNRNATSSMDGEVNFKKPTKLTDLKSPWLSSEVTWKRMKESRDRGARGNTRVEFNHKDSMGIDGKLAANLEKLGFNLGGTFSEMKRVKYVYDVEFWEM